MMLPVYIEMQNDMMHYRYSPFNKQITKLRNLYVDLFCSPIVINACLFYSWGKVVHRNWGDDINCFLLKALTGKKISYLYVSSLANRLRKDNFLVIGSTITMLTNSHTIIWGAGVIDSSQPLPAKPKKVLAVRGPLSRQYLLERGIACPPVYGDPAMLMKYYYKPNVCKKYQLGVIPHYDDFSHPAIQNLQKEKEVLIIKMEGYKDWLEVVNQICSCEYIASSSLHGLIMAETYDIPNLWIELYGKLLGGHFKFHDFFLSIGHDRCMPFICERHTTLNDILATRAEYVKGEIDLKPLINNSPFQLKLR